jgi:hypothetical protein
MAAPKPNPERIPDTDDFWTLPPDGSANVMDEERHQRLLQMPGVVVHRRDPNASLPPPTPIRTVGHITVEELRRLLGREPYGDEDDVWFQGEDDEPTESPTGSS